MCDFENTKNKQGFDMDLWWEDRSLPEKIVLGIGFAILGFGLIALFGWVVMLLWNWLMPDIFGLKRLSYWQAWGLLILSCILFKDMNFGSESSGRRSDRRRKRELRRYMQEEEPLEESGANEETTSQKATEPKGEESSSAQAGDFNNSPSAGEDETDSEKD